MVACHETYTHSIKEVTCMMLQQVFLEWSFTTSWFLKAAGQDSGSIANSVKKKMGCFMWAFPYWFLDFHFRSHLRDVHFDISDTFLPGEISTYTLLMWYFPFPFSISLERFPHHFLRDFHWEISTYTFLMWYFPFPFYECEISTWIFLRDFQWEISMYTFLMWYFPCPFSFSLEGFPH